MPGPGGSSFERCYSYIRQSYLVRELTGWDAPVKSRARVRTKPKRYIVDPSLTAALLGYDADRLLADRQMFGILFESLCMRDLSCYLASSTTLLGPRLHYYRDDYGLEIDAIIGQKKEQLSTLESYEKSLIYEYVTGKKEVPTA